MVTLELNLKDEQELPGKGRRVKKREQINMFGKLQVLVLSAVMKSI